MIPSKRRRARGSYRRILASFAEMAALAKDPSTLALRAPKISGWSVGQQIEHLILADRGIVKTLARLSGGDGDEGGAPTLAGRAVLALGFIPRGAGQAPGVLHPQGIPDADLATAVAEIEASFRALEGDLDRLAKISATSRHPVLGRFDPRRWLRFTEVHHRHHLRIVADIRRAARA